MKKQPSLLQDTETLLGVEKASGPLAKLKRKPIYVPSSDDPREELKRLVMVHKDLTKKSVAIGNMCTDKKHTKTGELIKCRLPADAMILGQELSKAFKAKAQLLKTQMLQNLEQIPIYQAFLSKVFGCGAIVSAYLVSEINIHLATKPSNLRRFCGLAVINGRLERRTKGEKNKYSSEMRVRIFQAIVGMRKNGGARKERMLPTGNVMKAVPRRTNKYMKIWDDYKARMQHSERYDKEANTLTSFVDGNLVARKGAGGVIDSTGWHKAADVFLEDLYMVWRSLEGLPVWPSYYAAKLGYSHLGKIAVLEPRILTVEQALDEVGFTGAVPVEGGSQDEDSEDDLYSVPIEIEEDMIAAE